MTLPGDFLRIPGVGDALVSGMKTRDGTVMEWPPPEFIEVAGVRYRRVSYSMIPDDVAAKCSALARGAQYEPVGANPDRTLQ